jgi:hypothetical protein
LSLDAASALRHLPGARIAPPICRGDLIKDIDSGVHAVVIIDGKFHQNLAVAPDEIVDALSCGIKVYGAASMGALRASELHPFGMIGHGMIFEHIVVTPDFRDDFLGQVFSDSDGAIRKLSHAYIDFYMNSLELERHGRLTFRERATLLKSYAGIFYADRGWPSLRAVLSKRRQPSRRLFELAERACLRMGSQKRRDAVDVLRRVGRDLDRTKTLNKRLMAGR